MWVFSDGTQVQGAEVTGSSGFAQECRDGLALCLVLVDGNWDPILFDSHNPAHVYWLVSGCARRAGVTLVEGTPQYVSWPAGDNDVDTVE